MRQFLCISLAFFSLLLSGCGTFTNRGGFGDRLEDTFWFKADTKEHRVLRSYVLLASMTRLATRSNTTIDERQSLAIRIGKAVRLAADAFECAYRPEPCAFFDDRMTALDIMLLQLAAGIFASPEDQGLINQLGNEFFGQTPINDVVNALTGGAKVLSSSASAVSKTTNIISALLTLSSNAFDEGARIGALYRDSIEMDMQVTVSTLAYYCYPPKGEPLPVQNPASVGPGDPPIGSPVCPDAFTAANAVYANGSGDLSAWRQYLQGSGLAYRQLLKPNADHFIEVSEVIWRACLEMGLQKTSDHINYLKECRAYDDPIKGGDPQGRLIFGKEVQDANSSQACQSENEAINFTSNIMQKTLKLNPRTSSTDCAITKTGNANQGIN